MRSDSRVSSSLLSCVGESVGRAVVIVSVMDWTEGGSGYGSRRVYGVAG